MRAEVTPGPPSTSTAMIWTALPYHPDYTVSLISTTDYQRRRLVFAVAPQGSLSRREIDEINDWCRETMPERHGGCGYGLCFLTEEDRLHFLLRWSNEESG